MNIVVLVPQTTNVKSGNSGQYQSCFSGINGINGTIGDFGRFQSGIQGINGTNGIIEDITKTLKEISIIHNVAARQNASWHLSQNEGVRCG